MGTARILLACIGIASLVSPIASLREDAVQQLLDPHAEGGEKEVSEKPHGEAAKGTESSSAESEGHSEASEEEHGEHAVSDANLTTEEKEVKTKQRQLGIGLSESLMAAVPWNMFVLWMVMYPDPQVKVYSVKTLSTCMIIFCALSIESLQLGYASHHVLEGPIFLMYWAAVSGVGFYLRHHHEGMVAFLAILSHVSAFVAVRMFSELFEKVADRHEHKGKYYVIGIHVVFTIITTCILRTMIWVTTLLLHKIDFKDKQEELSDHPEHTDQTDHPQVDASQQDSPVAVAHEGTEAKETKETSLPQEHSNTVDVEADHPKVTAGIYLDHETKDVQTDAEPSSEHHSAHHHSLKEMVIEEIEEANLDACVIIVSCLAKKCLAEMILMSLDVGDDIFKALPLKKFDPVSYHLALALFCAVTLGLYALTAVCHVKALSHLNQRFLTLSLAFTAAWMSIICVKLIVKQMVEDTTCLSILSALFVTPICCLMIIVLDKFADFEFIRESSAEDLLTGFGAVIGFAWEKAFHAADEAVVEDVTHQLRRAPAVGISSGLSEHQMDVLVALGVIAFILPGWRYLVLPMALQPIPPRQPLSK
jgi:hypothetical protein